MLKTLLFYLISFGTLASALGVVCSGSAVYSLLCLVSAMCFTAALFVLLKAFLVATVLVLVYAGAILVLFLFVVMWIDFRKISADWDGFKASPVFAVILGVLFFAQSFRVIRGVAPANTSAPLQGTAEAVGQLLFSRYMLAFELTAFLLLAAVISVVVLAKKEYR